MKRRGRAVHPPMPDMSWLFNDPVSGTLHERAARVLGWSVADAQSMSLAALREAVRPINPALAEKISREIESGGHIVGERHKPSRRRGRARGDIERAVLSPPSGPHSPWTVEVFRGGGRWPVAAGNFAQRVDADRYIKTYYPDAKVEIKKEAFSATRKKRHMGLSRRRHGVRKGHALKKRYGCASGAKPYFSPAGGVDSPGFYYGYAIKIDGLENDFPQLPPGRQVGAYQAVQAFKAVAKSDWISTKARDGRRPLAEVKKWIKAVQPSQFYARWSTPVNDDSIQIWYMP